VFEEAVYNKIQDPDTYTWCIYQIIGLLSVGGEKKQVLKEIKKGKVGWKSPSYDAIASKIEEYDEYLVKPFEVVEGVVECGKCHSKKTWSVQKQVKSGDENMTTFSRCVMCGNQWSFG
jgi:DNA-directed RNA polymerase subunit M/transcription elongation factor TFIIS